MQNLKESEGKEYAADVVPGAKKPTKSAAAAAPTPAAGGKSNFASAALFDQLSGMVNADGTIASKVGAIFVYKLSNGKRLINSFAFF